METPLDWDRFVSLAGGPGSDVSDVDDLARFYLEHTSEELAALDAAVRRGMVADVELIAHRLAGASATAGGQAMVQPLVTLEEMAHAGSIADAARLVDEAHAAFGRIRDVLADRLRIGKRS